MTSTNGTKHLIRKIVKVGTQRRPGPKTRAGQPFTLVPFLILKHITVRLFHSARLESER